MQTMYAGEDMPFAFIQNVILFFFTYMKKENFSLKHLNLVLDFLGSALHLLFRLWRCGQQIFFQPRIFFEKICSKTYLTIHICFENYFRQQKKLTICFEKHFSKDIFQKILFEKQFPAIFSEQYFLKNMFSDKFRWRKLYQGTILRALTEAEKNNIF